MFWTILFIVISVSPCGFADYGEAKRAPCAGVLRQSCVRRRPRVPARSGGASARKLPLRADEVAGVAIRVTFQVVLVLGLGLPELASGRNFRHHLARPQP